MEKLQERECKISKGGRSKKEDVKEGGRNCENVEGEWRNEKTGKWGSEVRRVGK